jgi:hypothetical protein
MGQSIAFPSPHVAASVVPAHIAELLGKAPLLKSEDPKQYQALLSEIARTVKPADVMEWLWVKDIVDLTWDILRYRRLKTSWIEAKRCEDSKVLDGFYVHWNAYGQLHLLEQMQASAELRRNNALNEIESRRASLGKALRQASDQVIEAQATPALAKAS